MQNLSLQFFNKIITNLLFSFYNLEISYSYTTSVKNKGDNYGK